MKKFLFLISMISFLECGMVMATQRSVPGQYSSIQNAIAAASSGDTIAIANGTYNESVTVNKSLTLLGSSTSVIITPLSGDGITITSNNVALQLLRVTASPSNGIIAGNVSDLSLINVSSDHNGASGIQFTAINGVTVNGCVFSYNHDEGFNTLNGSNYSIVNTIADSNGTTGNGSGVNLKGITGTSVVTNLTASGNKVHGLSIGSNSSNITVNGGTFNSNGTDRGTGGNGGGINVFASGKTLITNISIKGPLTANNNTTAGIWLAGEAFQDSLKDITVGSVGEVSLTNNGGAGVIVYGNVKNGSITAKINKGPAFATGVLIVGTNFSGASSPVGTSINHSTFNNEFASNQPAIALSAGVFPFTCKNTVAADSNFFLGSNAVDTLIYDKLDDPTLGLVAHTNDNPFPTPTLLVNRPAINFDDTAKDTTSTQILVIKNSSAVSLTIDSFYTKTKRFTLGKAKATVGPNDSVVVTVSFAPDSLRTFKDTLFIPNNSPTPLVKMPLSGSSPLPAAIVDRSSLEFGDVGVFDSSTTSIKISNSSVNILHVTSVYTSTASFKPLTVSGNVKKNDTLSIGVRFFPKLFGQSIDTLYVNNNSDNTVITIPLSGNSPSSTLSITPSLLAFGNVKKDSIKQLVFSMTNSSVSSLQVDSLFTKSKYFDVVKILANRIIKKGDTVTVSIRFKPDSIRNYVDTLYVANNSSLSPMKVPLTGAGVLTKVDEASVGVPTVFALYQNFPNPFNPSTTIRFSLARQSNVKIEITNTIGQKVATLINEERGAGYYEIRWNATTASGMYFCRFEATTTSGTLARFIDVRKMLLMK